MTSNFDEWRDDDFVEDNALFEDFPMIDDTAVAPPADDEDADEFDRLREKSTRVGAMSDGMEVEETRAAGGSRFSLSNFTTGQRLILALLLVLDILMVGFGLLVLTGRF